MTSVLVLAGQLTLAGLLGQPTDAGATMYKCQVGGRTVYQDQTCPGERESKPFKSKNPINTMSSEALTGKPKEKADDRPAWLKPMNPIDDCKSKGGKFDREFRACIVP